MQMSNIETSPAKNPDQPSTKHFCVDARFAAILHEDFPTIPAATILDALSDKPQRRAIAITEWAATKDDLAGALLAWSRKHRRGAYRRRCGRGRGLPTERPQVRHGRPRDNRPAPGRSTTPPSGAAVESLRGVRVSADALDALARRLGV